MFYKSIPILPLRTLSRILGLIKATLALKENKQKKPGRIKQFYNIKYKLY